MPIVMDSLQQLSILSYNCRGYNVSKQHYIKSLMNNVDFMFIQEHWLAESQLNVLSDLHIRSFWSRQYQGLIILQCFRAAHMAVVSYCGGLI